jgi:hypothetical protein
MKKIITAIILTTVSLSSFSEPSFKTAIPQPDYISNDWDGDGIINSEDPDDDGDGINDADDSSQFGGQSGKSVAAVVTAPTCIEDTNNYSVWMGNHMNFYIGGVLISPSKYTAINISDFNILGHRVYTGVPYTQVCYERLEAVVDGCVEDSNHKVFWRGNYFEYEIDGSYVSPTNRQSESSSGVTSREFNLFDKKIKTVSPFTSMCISDL